MALAPSALAASPDACPSTASPPPKQGHTVSLAQATGAAPGSSPHTAPRLSVIIVNYCQWEYTAGLVQQLLVSSSVRSGQAEVMVVDNHSPPHRLMRRMRRWPGVSLRRWGRNRGFARAVNEGGRLSQGGWLLLLNPDMGVPDGFLEAALDLAENLAATDPRAGIVGFRLRNADGTRQLSSGSFPTLPGILAGLFLPRWRRKYRNVALCQRCPVPWVTGCCLLVRRECLEQVGGLDEEFFLYYEDVDLCRRARAHGWSVWYEPALAVTHYHPLHSRTVPPALRLINRHSLLTYACRHWPRWQFQLLTGIVRAEAWVRGWWARRRKDAEAAAVFRTLDNIAAEMVAGDRKKARRRLERVVQKLEQQPQPRDLRTAEEPPPAKTPLRAGC